MSAAPDSAPRILVVEDDYFVALDLEGGLREAGLQVLGPCPTAEAPPPLAEPEHQALRVQDIRLPVRINGS